MRLPKPNNKNKTKRFRFFRSLCSLTTCYFLSFFFFVFVFSLCSFATNAIGTQRSRRHHHHRRRRPPPPLTNKHTLTHYIASWTCSCCCVGQTSELSHATPRLPCPPSLSFLFNRTHALATTYIYYIHATFSFPLSQADNNNSIYFHGCVSLSLSLPLSNTTLLSSATTLRRRRHDTVSRSQGRWR